MKEALGVLAVVLAFACYAPYIWDTLRGRTKPHLFTYLIWAIVPVVVFAGQIAAGAGPGAWTTGAMALLALVVLVLSFTHGTKDVTKLDLVFLIAAFAAIVPWYLTHNPTLSITLATIIDICAFAPTIRKTLNDHTSENLLSWVLNAARNAVAILALATFTFATVVFPLALLVMSLAVVGIIVTGKRAGN